MKPHEIRFFEVSFGGPSVITTLEGLVNAYVQQKTEEAISVGAQGIACNIVPCLSDTRLVVMIIVTAIMPQRIARA